MTRHSGSVLLLRAPCRAVMPGEIAFVTASIDDSGRSVPVKPSKLGGTKLPQARPTTLYLDLVFQDALRWIATCSLCNPS